MRSLRNLASLLQLIKVSKVEHIIIVIGEITKFWAEFLPFNFFTTMNCSPWVQKGNLAKIESSNISKTREVTPTKIGVHAFGIQLYLHKFSEPILFDSIFSLPQNWCTCITHLPLLAWIFWADSYRLNFLMTMDYIYSREIWPFLKVVVSSKPERSCPPKSM